MTWFITTYIICMNFIIHNNNKGWVKIQLSHFFFLLWRLWLLYPNFILYEHQNPLLLFFQRKKSLIHLQFYFQAKSFLEKTSDDLDDEEENLHCTNEWEACEKSHGPPNGRQFVNRFSLLVLNYEVSRYVHC